MKGKRGFTLIELLVVVAIIVVVVLLIGPLFGRARSPAWRSVCMTNLKAIGAGIAMYRQDNNDAFPLITGCIDPNGTFKTSTDGAWNTTAGGASPWGTAVQQNLFLLVYEGIVGEKSLLCPDAGDGLTDRTSCGPNGFGGPDNISYGLQFVDPASASSPYVTLKDEVAIVADEGDASDLTAASPNHKGDGGSVLFGGMHVSFEKRTDVGYKNNLIYTKDMNAADEVTPTSPGWVNAESANDSIICWKAK